MKSTVPDGEPITRGGLVALEAELAELEGAGRRAIAQRILAARELGDLSENAEYHIAKEEQAHLETRIKRLRQRRRDARVVETDAADATLSFGRGAEVIDERTGVVHTWTIVGSTEANLAQGKLSAQSATTGMSSRLGHDFPHFQQRSLPPPALSNIAAIVSCVPS